MQSFGLKIVCSRQYWLVILMVKILALKQKKGQKNRLRGDKFALNDLVTS